MKNIILFDNDARERLLPLTFTRPVAEIRIGILTIREKWERWLNGKASFITQDYLSDKFPILIDNDNYVINASVLPNDTICSIIEQMRVGEALLHDGELIAARIDAEQFDYLMQDEEIRELAAYELGDNDIQRIRHVWDLFRMNKECIQSDFTLITTGRVSQKLSATNRVIGDNLIFLEEGAKVECSILNTSNGPIYIGKNAEIMENCSIRGGLALCEGAVLKMGAKVYGPTTIGPYSKVGGEVNNSVILGNSNKGHEGYLGNSVLGEWCNLGADTNTSNLKNTYEEIKLWNYNTEGFEKTGLQFCGLIMGDHSKCGINTMFNTGTVVGVCANIFGTGYPRNFIPSFSWGGAQGMQTYRLDKVLDSIERVYERRSKKLDEEEREILGSIFEYTAKYRTWEKSNKIENKLEN